MCIIAVIKKGGIAVTQTEWNNCWNRNKDGFGMMWSENGSVKTFKSLDREEAYKTYTDLILSEIHASTDVVLHFRYGTQGDGIENCHPFEVNNKLWFCHNGVISQFSKPEHRATGMSDTRLFNSFVLNHLPEDFLSCETTVDMIKEFIGTDKLVFMDNTGTATIINESKGVVSDNEIWFSNSGYLAYESYYNRSYSYLDRYSKYTNNINTNINNIHICDDCGCRIQDEPFIISKGSYSIKLCDRCMVEGSLLYEIIDKCFDEMVEDPKVGDIVEYKNGQSGCTEFRIVSISENFIGIEYKESSIPNIRLNKYIDKDTFRKVFDVVPF